MSWNELLQLKSFFSRIRLRVSRDQKKKCVGHGTGHYLKEEKQETEEVGKNVKTHRR
jgi:hypothetical protein